MNLRDGQRAFWLAITHPSGVRDHLAAADEATRETFERTFAESEAFSRIDRVDVYAESYYWRLHGVLANEFELVAWWLGPDRFRNLCTDYVWQQPSTEPDLGELGHGLASYIAEHALGRAHPGLAELAAVERAKSDVFRAADAQSLTADSLRTTAAEAWPALRFGVVPALQRVTTTVDVAGLTRLAEAGESPPSTLPRRSSQAGVIVHRMDFDVRVRALEADEWRVFARLERGETFANLCSSIDAATPERAAQRAAHWLASWIAAGLLAQDA